MATRYVPPPAVGTTAIDQHEIGNVDTHGNTVALFGPTDPLGMVRDDENFSTYVLPAGTKPSTLPRSHPFWEPDNIPDTPDRKMSDDERWRAPGVPDVEFLEHYKAAENVCLPALPMPLRKWGREGIMLLKVSGLTGVDYAMVVPDDVAVGRYWLWSDDEVRQYREEPQCQPSLVPCKPTLMLKCSVAGAVL